MSSVHQESMAVSPTHSVEICPQCLCSVNSFVSRLIHDTCGHKKCRLCLLKEENGCLSCAEKVNARKEKVTNNSQEVDSNSNDSPPEKKPVSPKSSPDVHGEDTDQTSMNGELFQGDLQERNDLKPNKRKKLILENHITILPGTPKKFHCTICKKDFSSRMTIQYHNYCASKVKPFACEVCGKGFVTKSHFDYHSKIHTGILPFVCDTCGKGFKQKSKLVRHLTSHSDDRCFVCQECGKSFRNNESLKSHQRVHRGVKPHVCEVCSKSFIERSNYKSHVLAVHKGEKIYMCDTCGKTFALNRSLTTHILMVHKRIRNHVCEICNKPFSMVKDLKRHKIVHSVVRPHSCHLCGLGFRRKDNFERHMRNNHPKTKAVSHSIKQQPKVDNVPAEKTNEGSEEKASEEKYSDEEPPSSPEEVLSTPPPLSPIPPSQTVNIETLHSIPMIEKENNTCIEKPRKSVLLETCINIHGQSNNVNYTESSPFVNYSSEIVGNNQDTMPIQVSGDCNENITHSQRSDGSVSHMYQDTKEVVSHTIPNPKENVEHYRAVPVINGPSNLPYNYMVESTVKPVKRVDREELVIREATNCVPTITRTSEYISDSVITRNLLQETATVLKTISRHDGYRTIEPCSSRESVMDQPSLRKLLHDVKCSDGVDVLNLASDCNVNKRSLFLDSHNELENMRYNKSNLKEQFYSPKYPDNYMSEPLIRNEVNETPFHSDEQYFPENYNKRLSNENMFLDAEYKQNYAPSLNFNMFSSPYTSCEDNSGQNVPHHSNVLPHQESEDRFCTAMSETSDRGYIYKENQLETENQSNVSHHENLSYGVGQPVIVGAGKVINNVICSNLTS